MRWTLLSYLLLALPGCGGDLADLDADGLSGRLSFTRTLHDDVANSRYGVAVADLDTGTTRWIASPRVVWGDRTSLSRDGTTVAWQQAGADFDGYRLHTKVVDGGAATPLEVDDTGHHHMPTWSADGSRLWYAGAEGLTSVAAEGGSPTVEVPMAWSWTSVSPDGAWLLYTSGTSDDPSGLLRAPLVALDAVELLVPLTVSVGPRRAEWSPTMDRIAWLMDHDANDENTAESDWRYELWTMDLGTMEPELLVELPLAAHISETALAWSPDGTQIAFDWAPGTSESGGGSAIHVVDVATAEVRRITSWEHDDSAPSWSVLPD